jgi:hypothetical protein
VDAGTGFPQLNTHLAGRLFLSGCRHRRARWRGRLAGLFCELIGEADAQNFLQLEGGSAETSVFFDRFDPIVVNEGQVKVHAEKAGYLDIHDVGHVKGDILGMVEVIGEKVQPTDVGGGFTKIGRIIKGGVGAELKP